VRAPQPFHLICWALFAVAGCANDPTSVRVDLSLGAGVAAPSSLSADVYGRHARLAAAQPLASAALPGALLVKVPDEDQRIRIVVDGPGRSPIGFATVNAIAHQQVSASIVLTASAADSDGDGVPDAIDDCPAVSDPQQTDTDGDGQGDACAALPGFVSFVAAASAPVQHNTSSIGIDVPATTQAGDRLVLAAYGSGQNTTFTTPAGFTLYGQVASAEGFFATCFMKTAQASEPRVTFTPSSSTTTSAVLAVFRGGTGVTPAAADPSALTGAASGGQITFTVSPPAAPMGSRLVALGVYDAGEGETWANVNGWTDEVQTGVLALYDAPAGSAAPVALSASYQSGQGLGGATLSFAITP
jgi:hypothetical protein